MWKDHRGMMGSLSWSEEVPKGEALREEGTGLGTNGLLKGESEAHYKAPVKICAGGRVRRSEGWRGGSLQGEEPRKKGAIKGTGPVCTCRAWILC